MSIRSYGIKGAHIKTKDADGTPHHIGLFCGWNFMRLPSPLLVTFLAVHTYAEVAVSPLISAVVESDPEPLSELSELKTLQIFQQSTAIAEGLRSPDGLARDKETGDIYVSEEAAATIVRIKPDGTRKVIFDRETPLYERNGLFKKRVQGLRSPEGLALDKKGNLFVVEDIPGGRLLSYKLVDKSANPRAYGVVVPIPLKNSTIAWESVDVGPLGELLLAGSTVESFSSSKNQEGLFSGTVLYRDADENWWMPMHDTMTSYSAASFSRNGKVAFFACEITGDVGCLDLQSHTLRTYHADRVFKSPEGLCVLPDDSVLVAEEGGKIYRVDPIIDRIQFLYDHPYSVESIEWDAANHRLLLTDDQQGNVQSLQLKPGLDFGLSNRSIRSILFEAQTTPVEMIPDTCPEYLSRVLKVGGYDPASSDKNLVFKEFARNYCLISIDADAMLLSSAQPVEDPIKRIQLVMVAPYLMGIQTGQLLWSASVFAAVKESGDVLRTQLIPRQVFGGDLLERSCTPVGGQTVAVPMPFSARVNAEGIASVNFMGMGVTPDFYLILNTVEPDDSYMVVIQAGKVQQYALHLPPYNDRSHWVVSLIRKEPDIWKALSFEP